MKTALIPLAVFLIAGCSQEGPKPVHSTEPATAADTLRFVAEKNATYKDWSADFVATWELRGTKMGQRGNFTVKAPNQLRMLALIQDRGQTATNLTAASVDGVTWTETHAMGQVFVVKMDMAKPHAVEPQAMADPVGVSNPAMQLSLFQKMFAPKLQLRGTVDSAGQTMFVLEGTGQAGQLTSESNEFEMLSRLGLPVRTSGIQARFLVGKRDGFVYYIEFQHKPSALLISYQYTNLKVNQAVPDSYFLYSPPSGAVVTDASASAQPNPRP